MIDTNVYNYLVQSYIPKASTPYDIHKRSELRNIYNTIVNKSKKSPLYKVKMSEDKQHFALTLKDTALYLKSTLAAINGDNEGSVFHSQKAYSQRPDKATAEIIGEDGADVPMPFRIKINSLATAQRNESMSVYDRSGSLSSGTYTFTSHVGDKSYEFQFNIGPASTTNGDVLNKLSQFINRSNIGIRTGIVTENDNGKMHLVMESLTTGNRDAALFSFEDDTFPKGSSGIVAYFDLNTVKEHPSNASFEVNGNQQEAYSNQIVIDHSLKVTFLEPSEDPFQIVYQADDEKIIDGVRQITNTYNSLVGLAENNRENNRFAAKLASELKGIASVYKNDLESSGINITDTGKLEIEESLASQAARDGDLQKLLGSSAGLAGRLSAKMAMISIDPMEYIDKKLVTYPNTAKPGTANPYMLSIYSGMLFNYYC